jgi:hypothetical protein
MLSNPTTFAPELFLRLCELRRLLEMGFSSETAQHGRTKAVLSAGQCAAVAIIVQQEIGGDFVSARVEGESHWFNRLSTSQGLVDADITADQFGYSPVRIARAGELYQGTRLRKEAELAAETIHRSELLRHKTLDQPTDHLSES